MCTAWQCTICAKALGLDFSALQNEDEQCESSGLDWWLQEGKSINVIIMREQV